MYGGCRCNTKIFASQAVLCVTHLLHNCGIKVKSHGEDVDQLIEKVKLATVKNKIRQAQFATIGCRLQPVVTRWGSWLNATLYYAENLSTVKAIAERFKEAGILVTRAKVCSHTAG